jgi:polysaccharide export outer membrane protein
VAGGCLAGAGCHTTPLTAACGPEAPTVRMAGPEAAPDHASLLVGPQTVLQWSITSTRNQGLPPVNGQSTVRSDGAIDLGPYGSVPVGGLTTKQASDAIARHLSKHVPGVKVHLTAYIRQAAGRPAPEPAEQAAADPAAAPGHDATSGAVAPAGYQPAAPPLASPAPLQVGEPPLESPGPPLLGAAPDARQADKAPADKDKDKDKESEAGKKDESAENGGKGKGQTLAPPPLPPYHPGPHAPTELNKIALPPYRIEPPDILLVEYLGTEPVFLKEQAVRGQHLVRPDGSISLGIFGSVAVGGLTLEEARLAIASKLNERSAIDPKVLSVDVLAYNSKFYYVITDGAGYGEQIYRFPVTGSETVLDALAQIGGLPPVADKRRVWVARRTPNGGPPNILPVDYIGTTQGGLAGTNYQIMPGDRVYVYSDCWRRADTNVAKWLSPIERVLGATLLGSQTVNSIRNKGGGSGSGSGSGGTTP